MFLDPGNLPLFHTETRPVKYWLMVCSAEVFSLEQAAACALAKDIWNEKGEQWMLARHTGLGAYMVLVGLDGQQFQCKPFQEARQLIQGGLLHINLDLRPEGPKSQGRS